MKFTHAPSVLTVNAVEECGIYILPPVGAIDKRATIHARPSVPATCRNTMPIKKQSLEAFLVLLNLAKPPRLRL